MRNTPLASCLGVLIVRHDVAKEAIIIEVPF